MTGYVFHPREFISALGGPAKCHRRLTEMGIKLVPQTVGSWGLRGSMDVLYVANLMAHEAIFGDGPVDFNAFIKPAGGPIRTPRHGKKPIPRG